MRCGSIVVLVVLFAALLQGCLTVESKEYHFRLKTDHSGEGTILFVNIQSESDDSADISLDDFHALINSYLQGKEFENENPAFHNVQKRLYVQDGKVYGEVRFSFDSLAAVRLFRYDDESPYMYFAGSQMTSEVMVESNGAFGRDWMPVVFWPKDAREMSITTKVTSEARHHRSLAEYLIEWQKTERQDPTSQPQK